jgi:hypothetical protein
MVGGCDKGFCLNYWKLSYRRKFLRTIWGLAIVLVGAAAIFATQQGYRTVPGYVVLGTVLLIGVAQAIYNYSRWQSEARQ